MRNGEFLVGLLDPGRPAFVTAEDLDGPHREAIRRWQQLGFVAWDPGLHPAPGCRYCGEGVPYRAEGRLLCSACRSSLDPRELLAWAVHRESFLGALAAQLGLQGGVQAVGTDLWELGAGTADGSAVICFYHHGGPLSEVARQRLAAFRRSLVLHGSSGVHPASPGRWVALGELLTPGGTLAPIELAELLRVRGRVRFEADTGTLRLGAGVAGEVPVGSREWALLACLAEQLDQFVPYRELKRGVLGRTGGSAETEEATFCQKLKSRIKDRYVPEIDRLVVTSNKGDGYRLRGEGEA
jgi:hypothetical protein